jgi:hypothetical protein
MATTTNYGWTTPDDTDLVKDGAAAIRTLGSSADTTVKALSPGTTAGDLDYYTSGTAKARLGIGTAGQVLKVNSGATAPEWGAAGSPATSYTLLNTGGTNLTGATTITVSGLSGYNKLFVMIPFLDSAAGASVFTMRLNADSTSKYSVNGGFNKANNIGSYRQNPDTLTAWNIGEQGSGAFSGGASVKIDGANSSGIKVATITTGYQEQDQKQVFAGGIYTGTSVVSSVSVISSVGNLQTGKIFIYGAN